MSSCTKVANPADAYWSATVDDRWYRRSSSRRASAARPRRALCAAARGDTPAPPLATRLDVVPPIRGAGLPADAGEVRRPVLLVRHAVEAAGRAAVARRAVDHLPHD